MRGAALTALFVVCLSAGPAAAQSLENRINRLEAKADLQRWIGISGAWTNPSTDFIARGNANGDAGAVCLDGGLYFLDSALRYAGEFSGFRLSATVSGCQGFGTVSEPVPVGIDGRTTIGTFFTGGVRAEFPAIGRGIIWPYVGAGGVIARVNIQAYPFEQNSSWRDGWYYEVGFSVPLANVGTGIKAAGQAQGIDAAATELYMAYRHFDVGNQTLDGGAQTKTEWDMVLVGAKIRY